MIPPKPNKTSSTPIAMKSAEEAARFIRHRQRELAALDPEDRCDRLGVEIRQLATGISSANRRVFLEDLERLFPIGLADGATPALLLTPAPRPLGVDGLLAELNKSLAAMPVNERTTARARIADSLGIVPTPAAPPPPKPGATLTVQDLVNCLNSFKGMALADPDPVMNNRREEAADPNRTVETDVIEGFTARLGGLEAQPLSPEKTLRFAAAALVELSCLEQFGRLVLQRLDRRVFDPVGGRVALGEINDPGVLLRNLVEELDSDAALKDFRKFTGLIKILLNWYGYACGLGASALVELDPEAMKRKAKRKKEWFWIGDEVLDYEHAWKIFESAYPEVLKAILELDPAWQGDLVEEEIRDKMNKIIERRVIADLPKFEWEVREEDL